MEVFNTGLVQKNCSKWQSFDQQSALINKCCKLLVTGNLSFVTFALTAANLMFMPFRDSCYAYSVEIMRHFCAITV